METYKFKIKFGLLESETTVIKEAKGLFEAIKNVATFYFRCTIIDCYKKIGIDKWDKLELENIVLSDTNGFRSDILKQLVKSQASIKKQQEKIKKFKSGKR